MQFFENFVINNFVTLFLLIIGIFSVVYYRKSKNEISSKIINGNMRTIFSEAEYENFKRQAESVLNNTTISFSAKDVNNSVEKMNLYYCTVSVGNRIIRTSTFSISDVGEV